MKNFRNERIATEYLYSRYPVAKHIPDNKARLLKVKPLGSENVLFIWSIKIDFNLFSGVNSEGQEYTFGQSEVIDWLPYNGEALSEYEHIIIHPSLGILIDAIEVRDATQAEQIIRDCGEFQKLQTEMCFFSRYSYDLNLSVYELHYYWAKRIDLHSYAAVDIRNQSLDVIASNERVNFFYKGAEFEDFVLVEENGIMKIRKKP